MCCGEGCVCVCVLVKGVCVYVLGKVGSNSGLAPSLDLMCVTWLCRQNVELLLSISEPPLPQHHISVNSIEEHPFGKLLC